MYTATGCPSFCAGWYVHCETARRAAISRPQPGKAALRTRRSETCPSFPITALSTTFPWARTARAISGYSGLTLETMVGSDTPSWG